ncbi:MAG: hypothetical protein ACM3H7_00335 [Acidobacteriaceae bacterium]
MRMYHRAVAPDNRSSRRLLAFCLTLFGSVLIIGSLIAVFLSRSNSDPSANDLPRKIAGLTLNSETYGFDAIAEIARMHGKEFPTTYGAMGTYGDANQISIWIEGFEDQATASQIISSMAEKIALGNSPFSPTGYIQVEDRAVYMLDGMGQKHAYFQSGKLVLWLAAEPSVADQAIHQILEEYP